MFNHSNELFLNFPISDKWELWALCVINVDPHSFDVVFSRLSGLKVISFRCDRFEDKFVFVFGIHFRRVVNNVSFYLSRARSACFYFTFRVFFSPRLKGSFYTHSFNVILSMESLFSSEVNKIQQLLWSTIFIDSFFVSEVRDLTNSQCSFNSCCERFLTLKKQVSTLKRFPNYHQSLHNNDFFS